MRTVDGPDTPEQPLIAGPPRVCCVDLDGSLVAADLSWEAALRLVFERPWLAPMLPLWLCRGIAHLKRQVAQRTSVDAQALPYRTEVIDRLRVLQSNGLELVLATGSDELIAQRVFDHLGIFSRLHASNETVNLTGRRKAELLQRTYGHQGFYYVGNEARDIPVWLASAGATIVNATPSLPRKVARSVHVDSVLGVAPDHHVWLTALRPHQWAKNLLVFVPVITSHRLFDLASIANGLLAVAAFSACASAIYIWNDLSDLESDRLHPSKRRRPIAAGELSVPASIALATALLAVAALLSLAVGRAFAAIVTLYFLVASSYSFRLKREPVIDVVVLASVYVLRVYAGGAATGIVISNWLMMFALFVFVSLAFVKRCTELSVTGRATGRAYMSSDLQWIVPAGVGSGSVAVLVLALYISSPEVTVLYSRPEVLWLLCPILLYWITRTWLRASRGEVDNDPVLEALHDPISYACLLAGAIVLSAAL